MEFIRREGEEDNDLIYRLYQQKGTLTWREFTLLLNKHFGWDLSAECVRKRVRNYEADPKHKATDDLFRELEIKKQAFRDERNAWNRQNREQARIEENLSILQEQIKEISSGIFEPVEPKQQIQQKKSMLILLTDWHIGLEFKNSFGTYSPEIARERAKQYISHIQYIQEQTHCESACIVALGDMINGNIRRTVQLQNRINLIEQVKNASELISNFIHTLLGYFPQIYYSGCSGNHSRIIESKEDSLKDERLDNLIDWIVSKLLSEQKNFHYVKPFDNSMTILDVLGHKVVGVHGDYDYFSKQGLNQIVSFLHDFPEIVCMGHMHTGAYLEDSNTVILRGGSLCGAGDDYTIQKRIRGRASQVVAIIGEDGLESIHPVILK